TIGVGGEDLDRGDIIVAVEIGLRFGKWHEHHARVIFRHADLEHGRYLVRLDARRRTHRRHGAARRYQRDAVAGVQRQLIGKSAADGDALPFVKAFERALLDVLGDRGEVVQIVGADAANQDT